MTLSTSVPPTRREDVVDTYHGTAVPDPYRWLEDGDDAEVVAWVAAQNELTRSTLDIPARADWHRRLVALMELPVLQHATLRGDRLFCYERPAGAEQFVLTRRSAVDPASEPVVLRDPATSSADAATAIDWYYPSSDGALVAVGISEGGTEHSVLHLLSGVDGSPAGGDGDRIPDTRACSVAWEPDGSGFFYVRYPAGDEYNRTVHHHRLGTDWRDDPVVWDDRPDPQAWPDVDAHPRRPLADRPRRGRLSAHGRPRPRSHDRPVDDADRRSRRHDVRSPSTADGRSLVGITNLDAPRGRVVRVALDADVLARGPEAWDTIVAEGDDVIAQLAVTRHGLLMVTSAGAVDTVHRLDADGPAARPRSTASATSISVADDGLAADSGRRRRVRRRRHVTPPRRRCGRSRPTAPATPGDATVGRRAADRRAHGRAHQLPIRGRDRDRPVPHPPCRRHAERRHPDHPQRLRRVHDHDEPGVAAADRGVVRGRRPVRRRRAARRPRARRGVAHRPDRAATSRTSSTTSTPPPTTSSSPGSPAGGAWRSSAGPTAGCSSASP